MELTRRDVLAALAATGVAGGGAVFVDFESESGTPLLTDHEVATLVAVAEVAYPSAISGVESFVTNYSVTRANDDTDYRAGMKDALSALDDATSDWFDGKFVTLDKDMRSNALQQVGAVTGEPNPDGLRGERIRYYVLNELLFALYTTPTGSGLVGLENPPGYPGGDTSYQRGPQS